MTKRKNDDDKQRNKKQAPKSPAAAAPETEQMEVDDDENPQSQILDEIDEENLLEMEVPPMPEPVMASDGTGKRLIITQMEVENFKSYYGKQIIGPFHKNFTAVIGPNGSGKSNVIDALLFVFGYRSTKIRSKKLSVLIHSSAGRNNIPSCTVSAHFKLIVDKPDNTSEDVPNSRFFISRTAYRDNSSKYTYNGRTMQFKEIAKHLRVVGIDLIHNRFLILQGEVEQISLMKPKAQDKNEDGMLEYLEDIIGSSRLKLPIEKLQAKVEKLQEERGAQLTRLKYAEKEKDEKEGPVKKLIEQIRVENAIALAKNKIFHFNRVKVEDELEELRPRLVEVHASLEESRTNLKDVLARQKERKNQHKHLQRKYDQCQEEHELATKKLSENKQQLEKAKNEETRLNEKREKVEDDLKKENKKITELEEAPEKAKPKIAELKSQIEDAKQVIQENEGIVQEKTAEFDKRTDDLKKQKKQVEERISELSGKEDEANKNLVLAQEELHMLRSADDREKTKLADIKDALADAENSLDTKKTELQTVRNALPRVQNELQEKSASLNQLRQEEIQVNDEYREIRLKYEQSREHAEQSKSSNKLLNALMDQKRRGEIPGIFGRLGDLGAVDQKYDVAISTTCGALDYIVTDNMDTAQQCVEFLKKNNLGMASFIALDKQQHLVNNMRNKPQTPENAPRMFDLIKVLDEKILPAFYFTLRDTLVADDIVAANRIAFGGSRRWRTITLKGEVIETHGSMTGGGKSTKRGRIGQNVKVDTSKDNSKDLVAMERRMQELQDRLTDIRRQISGHEQKITALQADVDRMTRSNKTLSDDIKNLEDKLKSMAKQVSAQEQKVKESSVDQKAVEDARKRVEKFREESDVASEQTDKYRTDFLRLNNQIEELYEEIVGKYKTLLEDAQRKKETSEKAISKEQSAANTAARNLAKAKARAEEFQNDLDEAVRKLEECASEQKRLKDAIKRVVEEVKEKEAALQQADVELKEALNANTDLNDEEVRLQKQIEEIERDVSSLKGQIAQHENEIRKFTNDINGLKVYRVRGMFRMPDSVVKRNMDDEFFEDTFREEISFVEQEKERTLLEEEMEADPQDFTDKTEVPTFEKEEVREFILGDIKFRLATLEQKKATYKDPLKMYLLEEYMERLEKYEKEYTKLQEIQEKRDKHREFCERLKKQRLHEFMEGFSKIGLALKELYQTITIGGDASLDLVDTLDPFAEGVTFAVRPPKKSWKQITNLSGGEKTLSSLALVFGLHQFRPTPLYVMDEIDAALDFRNVSIIAHYVKERTKNAQFIIISLRNNMFELADRLIGIYKTFDCTKNVVVDPKALALEYQEERQKLEESRRQERKKKRDTQQHQNLIESPNVIALKRNRNSEVLNPVNQDL